MTPSKDRKALLELAKVAAAAAGKYLAGHKTSIIVEENRRDVKLDADRAAEELIVKTLQVSTAFPILTEEMGWIGKAAVEDFRWIVDPLDGTVNFLRGIPLSCVSVALWKDNEPVLGVIHDFARQEVFYGIAGEAAWLGDTKIVVSGTRNAKDSILFTGFPVGGDFSSEAIHRFINQVIRYKKIRSVGSAALALAYVASGRGDLYYERDVKIWDVAAGLAIVKAAGGSITIEPSEKLHCVTAWAGNPHLEHHFD